MVLRPAQGAVAHLAVLGRRMKRSDTVVLAKAPSGEGITLGELQLFL